MHLDLPRREHVRCRNQVGPRRIGFDAERDDVRMFEKEEKIRDLPGAPLFD